MKRKSGSKGPPKAQRKPAAVVVPFPKRLRPIPATAEPIGHPFKFRLRNGYVGAVVVPEEELDRLWYGVQEPDNFHQFIVFDSNDRRMALNLQHVVASQFYSLGEGGLQGTSTAGGDAVEIIFADSPKPLMLEVEADEMTILEVDEGGVDDNDACQLANLFFYFDSSHNGSDYAERLRDADGSVIWLRLNDIAFASAPLALIPTDSEPA
jgi:hypothetical protein